MIVHFAQGYTQRGRRMMPGAAAPSQGAGDGHPQAQPTPCFLTPAPPRVNTEKTENTVSSVPYARHASLSTTRITMNLPLRIVVPFVAVSTGACAGAVQPPGPAGPAASGVVPANGVELYYEAWGAGQPLVLVEGLGVATWTWELQLPALSRHFSVIAYDNRGVGRSSKPAGPYSVAQMADDLAGLLDALRIERAHVLGTSMGGMIAQEFALRHPARVDRLVLVATTAGGATHVPMSAETLARFLTPAAPGREGVRERMRLAFSDDFLATPYADRMIDHRLADPQPQHAFQAQAAAGATFDRASDIARISAPTLILAATHDLLVPLANARHLHQRMPNSTLIEYDGLGHQFFIEAADRFNRDVIDFLRR
jgi:pimeloyl-ACP methyl ester carboxylesterase